MIGGVIARNKKEIGYFRGDAWGYSSRSKLRVELELELRLDKERKVYELSISGNVWSPRKAQVIAGGQIYDEIERGLKNGSLILTVPKYNVVKLLKIWRTYHLNDMKPVPYEQKDAYENFIKRYERKCGGYPKYEVIKVAFPEYGEKWYFWEIPRPILRWLIAKWFVNNREDAYKETDRILNEIDKVMGNDY